MRLPYLPAARAPARYRCVAGRGRGLRSSRGRDPWPLEAVPVRQPQPRDGAAAMAKGYSELANELVNGANGVDYAYRDTGGGEDGLPLVPAPALPRESRQLGPCADRRAGTGPAGRDV